MSKNYIKVNSLSVSEELLNFVNREAIEGTNLNKKNFGMILKKLYIN